QLDGVDLRRVDRDDGAGVRAVGDERVRDRSAPEDPRLERAHPDQQGRGRLHRLEEVRDKIQDVPGVVASTPFVVSEVVIAANNNYFNVIIKGIDPESIGTVTHLIDDLECDETDCSPAEA